MRLNEEDINYIYRQVRKELIREGFWDKVKNFFTGNKSNTGTTATTNTGATSNTSTGTTTGTTTTGTTNTGATTTSTTASGNVQDDKNIQVTTGGSIGNGVVYDPLKVHISKVRNRQIKYLAIHYTAGGTSKAGSAASVKKVFQKRRASADFAVDDTSMYQFNPDPRVYGCWAVGDASSKNGATNQNTVSIEMCSNLKPGTNSHKTNHSGWYFTEATLNNAIKLARIICKTYNIPKSNIVRHFDITGKVCPGVPGWNTAAMHNPDGSKTGQMNNEEQWRKFLASI